MNIVSAEFVISAASPQQFLKRPVPHFAFVGRSNVGKSSLLNRLLNRKSLAKTSGNPGKTRLINYFLINDRFFFVDLPGYGYAKVSKRERAAWAKLIEAYLLGTEYFALIFSLMDIRHKPSAQDRQMFEWLSHFEKPFLVLLTKADKLSKNRVNQQHALFARELGIDRDFIIPTSASSGLGMKEVWSRISEAQEHTRSIILESRNAP